MLTFLLVLLAIYVLVLLAVAWMSLRPPRIPVFISPGAMGAPQEEVTFQSEDGVRLQGWWVANPGASTVVILPHGYIMNRAELTPLAVKLWQEGAACFLPDFRAHGRSGNAKSTMGWLERRDVLAAVRLAREKMPGAKIVLIGSSMGAAASAFATAEQPELIDGVVLDSAYSYMPNAVSGWWRFVGGKVLAVLFYPVILLAAPMGGINPWKIDVAKALSEVKEKPILIIHGDCDDLARPSEAKRNMEALRPHGELVWLPNCGHSEGRWVHPELYHKSVLEFLRKHGLLQP